MRPTLILLAFAIALLSTRSSAQSAISPVRSDTLALIDGWPVTAQDLYERIALMPFDVENAEHNHEARKRKAVESLVGERLLALSGEENTSIESWRIKTTRAVLEKMFVRDKLYQLEIRDRIVIRPEDVQSALRKAVSDSAAAGTSTADRERVVREQLERRMAEDLIRELTDRLLRGQQMEADSGVFRMVVRKLREAMGADPEAHRVPKGFRPLQDDIYRIISDERSMLDAPIVRGSFGAITLGEFLESLLYYDVLITSLDARSFAPSVFEMLRAVVEAEIVAQEGIRRGLQYDKDVLRDVALWMNFWTSRWMEYAVTDTAKAREEEALSSHRSGEKAIVDSTHGVQIQEIRQGAIDRHVAQLALQRSVKIFLERISATDVPAVNMLTRRLIGFGGRINAAPVLIPQWRWVEEWKRAQRQLP